MSQFYDQASLVMVPSGYKDGKLYSQKPLSSSGELTFSRGSDIEATRVASNGYIEKARANLLLYSNQPNNWSVVSVSLTGGQSGYDGSSDAWLFDSSAGYIRNNLSLSGVYTFSIYAKQGTADGIRLRMDAGTDADVYISLTDGSESLPNTGIDYTATSVGGGWWRISVTANDSAFSNFRVYAIDGSGNATTGTIYIQDAQVNYGLVAQEYQETTTASVVAGITNDLPRLDYSGGASCPSLLLEPSRTNIIESSEFINGAGWSLSGTPVITQNYGISPEGVINSVLVDDDSSGGFEAVTNAMTLTSGTTYTGSFYIKKATSAVSHYAGFTIGGFPYIIIDNYNGTTNTTGGTGSWSSIKMETFNNNWWRFSATMTATASGTASFSVWPAISSNGTSIDSSATGTQEFYGFQCEAGSHSTSLIPTYGTSATRTADACSKTGISSLIGQTEGTLFVEFQNDANFNSSPDRIISISDGTGNNRLYIAKLSTGASYFVAVSGGTQTGEIIGSAIPTGNVKIAIAYKANDCIMYINGAAAGTDTSVTIPACSQLFLGQENGGTTAALFKPYKQALLFKTRLSNADLATLTA